MILIFSFGVKAEPGKEVYAQAIHNESRPEAHLAVNCAAIPKTLIESELFGYEGGRFYRLQNGRVNPVRLNLPTMALYFLMK